MSATKSEALGKGKLILIADDDSSIRGLLQTLFSGEGYRTQEAATGRDVMPAIHKLHPDLLLMDVRMPGLSGMEVLEHMKSGGVDIPVLLMTAFTASNVATRAMQLGAYDYVTKPFDIDDLLLTVQRTLDHRDLAARVQALDETPRDPMDNIIGTSPVMLDVSRQSGGWPGQTQPSSFMERAGRRRSWSRQRSISTRTGEARRSSRWPAPR